MLQIESLGNWIWIWCIQLLCQPSNYSSQQSLLDLTVSIEICQMQLEQLAPTLAPTTGRKPITNQLLYWLERGKEGRNAIQFLRNCFDRWEDVYSGVHLQRSAERLTLKRRRGRRRRGGIRGNCKNRRRRGGRRGERGILGQSNSGRTPPTRVEKTILIFQAHIRILLIIDILHSWNLTWNGTMNG